MSDFKILEDFINAETIILGIGNVLRQDDGFGSILAGRLNKKIGNNAIDCGVSPENYLGPLVKKHPERILIVDTLDFGGSAGAFKVLDGRELKTANLFSTHNASLSLLIKFLKERNDADIMFLAVQPKRINFGEGLSKEAVASLEKLETFILGQIKNNPKRGG